MKKQHTDFYRKILLRKSLLKHLKNDKKINAYIPFIGDGDIAHKLYTKYNIYGADIEKSRIEKAKQNLPKNSILKIADCNKFPFVDKKIKFSLADFDAYSYPYEAFRSFWENASKTDKMIIFFTDGQKQAIVRTKTYTNPDGKKIKIKSLQESRQYSNFYFDRILFPWIKEYIKPYSIKKVEKYNNKLQLYWGIYIEVKNEKTRKPYKFNDIKKEEYLQKLREGLGRTAAAAAVGISRPTIAEYRKKDKNFIEAEILAEQAAIGEIEDSLFVAAKSGNLTAIIFYLCNRAKERWQNVNKVQMEHSGKIETVQSTINILNQTDKKTGRKIGEIIAEALQKKK